jgi:hypothetical protein
MPDEISLFRPSSYSKRENSNPRESSNLANWIPVYRGMNQRIQKRRLVRGLISFAAARLQKHKTENLSDRVFGFFPDL